MDKLYKPSVLSDLLKEYGFRFQKSLGQNFLIDGNIVKKIADSANIENRTVLEIGPGVGTLTQELLTRTKDVIVVEKDLRLKEILQRTVPDAKKYFCDFLDIDMSVFKDREISVVANLPYYITTPIIEKLLTSSLNIKSITIMVQREVAKRMCAGKDDEDYGSLSVFIKYYAHCSYLFDVKKTVFMPRPKVDSAVLRLDIKDPPITDKEIFFKILRSCFSMRRKTIVNALKSSGLTKNEAMDLLEISNIDYNLRAENLSFEDYLVLSINYDTVRRYDGRI